MIEKINRGWSVFQEAIYDRSQEARVPIDGLDLSKRAKVSHLNVWWFDGGVPFLINMIMDLIFAIIGTLMSLEVFPRLIAGTMKWEEFVNGVILLGIASVIPLTIHMKTRWIRRSCLVNLMLEIKDDKHVRDLLDQYKWVYITYAEIIFTNVKPFFLFQVSDRFSTSYPWEKPYRRDPATWFLERVIGGIYLRILWPYLINPLQLAFLEYDKAARRIDLRSGQKVLIIGAGAVPHHIRWKNRLGPSGKITALDIDPFVLDDSEKIERLIEWMRGIFGKSRWLSEYISGDAAELPFEAGAFDAVIAIRCYFVSVDEALRVLKPDGKILISTCGDIAELPRNSDPRLESTSTGWIVTNTLDHVS